MAWLVQLAQLVCSEQGFLQDGRELWLGFPGQEGKGNESFFFKSHRNSCVMLCAGSMHASLTGSFFTNEAMGSGSAWIGPKSWHLRLLQVGAETRVTGLTRQPTQAAVGKWGHVLPTPVWHVDFPQAHPGRQLLWRQGEGLRNAGKAAGYSNAR